MRSPGARSRHAIVFILTMALGNLACRGEQTPKASTHPNIVLVIADDMRHDQLSSEGHPFIRTPHLDRLADEGIRLTNAYPTSPLCGPSRASLLTARMPSRHSRVHNHSYPDSLDPFLPEAFKAAGYRTALIGKSHVGESLRRRYSTAFDRWFVNLGPRWPPGSDRWSEVERLAYYESNMYYDQIYSIDGEKRLIKGHQTDVLFDEAVRFANEKSSQPFFSVVTPFAPHAPFNPTERRKNKYRGKGVPDSPTLHLEAIPADLRKMIDKASEGMAAMIEDIDDGIGRIYNALERSGQLDNTVIIFSSDNGTMLGEHGCLWKRHPWQESVRVPLLVRYPHLVDPNTTSDALFSLADLLVTIAEIAGVELPDDEHRYGISQASVLSGETDFVRESLLLQQYLQPKAPNDDLPEQLEWVGLLDHRHKLIAYLTRPPTDVGRSRYLTSLSLATHAAENLTAYASDPMEQTNLADDPTASETKRDLLARLRSEMAEQGVIIDTGTPPPPEANNQ